MKILLTVAASVVLFVSCQTSHGCGCLQSDNTAETELVQEEA